MAKKSKRPQAQKGFAALEALQTPSSDTTSDRDSAIDESWNIPEDQQIPLQVLKQDDFVQHYSKQDTDERMRSLLKATALADQGWQALYDGLCDRIKNLAAVLGQDEKGDESHAIVVAEFPGYTRVGGLPGFWERLLPAMHPIYGIPYVPASSIKGVIRAWARNTRQPELDRLLGHLNGNEAAIAAVQILDAFPMQPCLKVDVATPQWKWENEIVKYGTVPHQLLSLENLKLQIGLRQTSQGTIEDVKTVLTWLQDALLTEGLGSRTSVGYGRASRVNNTTTPKIPPNHRFISRHKFEFWSQGMYGLTPPTKENHYRGETEFRATAVRGILRYWFRAIALGLFPSSHCQTFESILFGILEPKARHGHFRISVSHLSETPSNGTSPHHVSGTIVLEATTHDELTLLQQILRLATHLGGVGRGSRRPLHVNQDGNRKDLRGCYWQIIEPTMNLAQDSSQWNEFLNQLHAQITTVKEQVFSKLPPEELRVLARSTEVGTGSPGSSGKGKRYQDVLNANTRIYLLKTSTVKLPSQPGWEAAKYRGTALEFFYSSGYKGVNQAKQGNPNVGGALETPSFVWITSNHLDNVEQAYQVITVFGADQPDRAAFCRKLTERYESPVLTEISL